MGARLASLLLAVPLVLTAWWAAPAGAGQACSSDSFTIDGAPVRVQICAPPGAPRTAPPGRPSPVGLTETLVSRNVTFSREVALDYFAGADYSRAIDDAPLQRFGIAKTLHMTIGYKPGSVRLEHALLVPGAIALK